MIRATLVRAQAASVVGLCLVNCHDDGARTQQQLRADGLVDAGPEAETTSGSADASVGDDADGQAPGDAGTRLRDTGVEPDSNAKSSGADADPPSGTDPAVDDERGPTLTCDALAAKYRECGILGVGDFDCNGHRDACVMLCEQRMTCASLADWICTDSNDSPIWECLFNCVAGAGGFICREDGVAITKDRFCDGTDDCLDGSDERHCPALVCSIDWKTVVPGYRICDGINDCFDGEDEDNCPDFTCADGSSLPHEYRCDEFSDCFDKTDELGCDLTSDFAFVCSDSTLLPINFLCDGTPDCRDGLDEGDCAAEACSGGSCPGRYVFVCADGSLIARTSAFDGVPDCVDGSDEYQTTQCMDGSPLIEEKWCDGVVDCVDGSDERCDLSRCNGIREQDDWSDETDCCDSPPCAQFAECSQLLPKNP